MTDQKTPENTPADESHSGSEVQNPDAGASSAEGDAHGASVDSSATGTADPGASAPSESDSSTASSDSAQSGSEPAATQDGNAAAGLEGHGASAAKPSGADSAAGGHGDTKSATPSGPNKIKLIIARIKQRARFKLNLAPQVRQVVFGIFSSDAPTQRMSLLFILSLMGFFTVSVVSVHRFWNYRLVVRHAAALKLERQRREIARKEEEELRQKESVISIGIFTLQVRPGPHRKPATNGETDTADVEVVVISDGIPTKEFIASHKVQARSQLSALFNGIDRDEFMSKEGKQQIKVTMIRKMNMWLDEENGGKIEDLYFTNLVVY